MEEKFGKYEVIAELGEGATAFVYHARDIQLKREVALKVLKPALVADGTAFERFMQEAQAAANLFHPHIATVLDMREADGRYYIAMRHVDGESLDKIIKKRTLSWEDTLKLVKQIGDALDFAHAKGFIHRDIKPSNIILDEDGNFWLTDFGLTRAMMSTGLTSHSGAVLGTPAYIAPEIWQGEDAQPATDQYALACVVYEALTGKTLFQGDTPPATMKRHFDPLELPTEWPDGVQGDINTALAKSLAKGPDERFGSASYFSKSLQSKKQITENVIDVSPQPSTISTASGNTERVVHKRDEAQQIPTQQTIREPGIGTLATSSPDISLWKRWWFWAGAAGLAVLAMILSNAFGGGRPEVVVETVVVEVTSTEAAIAMETTTAPTPMPDTPTPASTLTRTTLPSSPTTIPLGIGSTQVSPKDGMVQMYVPSGDFEMGSNENYWEKPIHTVHLDAFWIDKIEVTNEMYEQCVSDGVCNPPSRTSSSKSDSYYDTRSFANYPIIYVSWTDARIYCEWAGRRLPTEAEWEKAARGNTGSTYPWGDEINCQKANYWDWAKVGGCVGGTTEAGSYPAGASPYGALDMAGNVQEWVADWFDAHYYANSPTSNPKGPMLGDYRVKRGGSWTGVDRDVRSTDRAMTVPDGNGSNNAGFRCAMDADQ
ncbi:MAG: SUMF1/EgtB/PvdO family nonheme iron enzyme [Chloroflexi bacterium]|nr:SUMF1/EgtB/PvdO family nonheme iron enzyme [Chloroflexota bacterium]